MGFIALVWLFIIITDAQDYQVFINQSAINEIKNDFMPLFYRFIFEELVIPPQTIVDVVDVDIGSISVAEITSDDITIDLNPIQQSIDLQVNNLELVLNTFQFKAHKKIFNWKVSCVGHASPVLQNWNISFSVFVSYDGNCTFSVDIDSESIIIDIGSTDLNTQFNTDACETLYDVSDFLLDIQQQILKNLLDIFPALIDSETQKLINELLRQVQYIQIEDTLLEVCIQDIQVNDHDLFVSADLDFVDTKGEQHDPPITTKDYGKFSKSDDFTLLIAIIIYGIILFFCGISGGSLITYCVYRKTHARQNKMKEANKNSSDNTVEMISSLIHE